MRQLLPLLLIFTLFLAPACTDDSERQALLEGRWNLVGATRDGANAPTLEGLYFVFEPDGQLLHNMFGTERQYTYKLKGKNILQTDGGDDVTYGVKELDANNLILEATISDLEFVFTLAKAK